MNSFSAVEGATGSKCQGATISVFYISVTVSALWRPMLFASFTVCYPQSMHPVSQRNCNSYWLKSLASSLTTLDSIIVCSDSKVPACYHLSLWLLKVYSFSMWLCTRFALTHLFSTNCPNRWWQMFVSIGLFQAVFAKVLKKLLLNRIIDFSPETGNVGLATRQPMRGELRTGFACCPTTKTGSTQTQTWTTSR